MCPPLTLVIQVVCLPPGLHLRRAASHCPVGLSLQGASHAHSCTPAFAAHQSPPSVVFFSSHLTDCCWSHLPIGPSSQTVLCISDSAPRGHVAVSGDICGCRNWHGGFYRPGMLLNFPQCLPPQRVMWLKMSGAPMLRNTVLHKKPPMAS